MEGAGTKEKQQNPIDPRRPRRRSSAHRWASIGVKSPFCLVWCVPPARRSTRMGCSALHRTHVIHRGVTVPNWQMALLHWHCCIVKKGRNSQARTGSQEGRFHPMNKGECWPFSSGAEKQCSDQRFKIAVFKWQSQMAASISLGGSRSEHTKCAKCRCHRNSQRSFSEQRPGAAAGQQTTAALTVVGSFPQD